MPWQVFKPDTFQIQVKHITTEKTQVLLHIRVLAELYVFCISDDKYFKLRFLNPVYCFVIGGVSSCEL